MKKKAIRVMKMQLVPIQWEVTPVTVMNLVFMEMAETVTTTIHAGIIRAKNTRHVSKMSNQRLITGLIHFFEPFLFLAVPVQNPLSVMVNLDALVRKASLKKTASVLMLTNAK